MPGLGVFHGPNLTPDQETGLGKWSAEQIVTAITRGQRPDARMLAPIMHSGKTASGQTARPQVRARIARFLWTKEHATSEKRNGKSVLDPSTTADLSSKVG